MTFPPGVEPDYFTLEQICQRWSDWHCTNSKLFQLCRSDKIEIGVNLPPTTINDTSIKHDLNTVSISGYFALSIHDIEKGCRYNHETITTNKVYKSRNDKNETGKPITTAYILPHEHLWSLDYLVITKIERDIFEDKSKTAVNDNKTLQQSNDKTINPRVKTNLLRGIKLLCHEKKINPSHPTSGAETMIRLADKAGFKIPTKNTIAGWLKDLPDD